MCFHMRVHQILRRATTYVMKMHEYAPSTVRSNSGQFYGNETSVTDSLCLLSISAIILIAIINYCWKLYQIHPNLKKQHYFPLED